MFPSVSSIELLKVKKVNQKLSICNPSSSVYFQLGKLEEPAHLKWGASVPYGKDETTTDHFVVDVDVNENMVEYFAGLDEHMLRCAQEQTGNKRLSFKSTVQERDDGAKFVRTKLYMTDQAPMYDEEDNKSNTSMLTGGSLAIVMVKLTSLWISGGECGIGLRIKKAKKVGVIEPVADVIPDFI